MAWKPTYAVGLLVLPIALPILLFVMVGGQAQSSPVATCGDAALSAGPSSDPGLDAEQTQVAQQIVAAVRAFPTTSNKPRAAVIALATAMQESGIRNLDYGDRDSLGAFQQRPSQGWGTPTQIMNVPHATTTFLEHLILIPEWESRRVTDVAADVQRPAEEYRGLYEQWVPLATRLTEQLWPGSTPEACGTSSSVGPGSVVYPVPPALIGTDNHNWGSAGSHWHSWHTGTDFSVPCGTPVLAATSGTVEIDTTEAWAGRWLVKVVTGPDSVATWYAHMQSLDVRAGQPVDAGERLGEAGARGNATGCHLHFEVHLRNGSIYGPDNVDPTTWLAANVGKPTGGGDGDGGPGSFVIATLNTLGDSHTRPGGNKLGWAGSATRTRWLAEFLVGQGPDVVGLQEFQGPQARVFREVSGETWGSHGNGDNVVIWRRSTFRLDSIDAVTIPYLDGHPRQMPLVRLKSIATGQVVSVLNVHNPADVRGPAAAARAEAIERERAAIVREQATGYPAFLVGDLNDRGPAFCRVTDGALLLSASGGSNTGTCKPPVDMSIDWLFGAGAKFDDYLVDNSTRGRISDHPYVEATVELD